MKLDKLVDKFKGLILLGFVFFSNNSIASSVRGRTDGVANLSGRAEAVKSVNQIANLIYTFSIVVFIMVCIVGTIVGIWSTLKHMKGQNIDIAEILITWCQIAFIIFICYSAKAIAGYIASNGYTVIHFLQ